MKAALEDGADPNAKDPDGTPALMNAALYGTASHMKMLLDRGADANARNAMDATALIWAAGDPAKVRMLVQRGADVNAQSKLGRTALMAAASVAGNAATVKLLLAKGARVDLKDNINPIPVVPAGGGKGTALMEAARTGDLETVKMLLAAGADVKATDARNGTALSEAVMYSRRDVIPVLLAAGADASGAVTLLKFPYLTLAAMRGDVEVARMLIQAKAPVNAADMSGVTPLMFAAAYERGKGEMVEFLLNAGGDVHAKSKAGETALTWALRRGETASVRMLREAGAAGDAPKAPEAGSLMGDVPVHEAVRKAIGALGKSSPVSFKKTACASCHHQTLPMVASATAASKGIQMEPGEAQFMTKATVSMLAPMAEPLLEGSDVPPDIGVTSGYLLEGLRAQGFAANQMTAAVVHKVAQSQMSDGSWAGWAPRAPIESGDIQATAMSIRALVTYPIPGRQAEMDQRIRRARQWLAAAKPATTEEYIMRLEGLRESGAPAEQVAQAARELTALQRPDGGWAQLPTLGSDAYATGKALVALHRASAQGTAAAAGLKYLRNTQEADGSWHVVTRSFPFQPLIDTGFPHGRDQWISAAGTSWAAQALALYN